MAVKAEFKTAYLQREIVIDTKVAADLVVGQLVNLTGTGDTTSIAAATTTTVTEGQYIVAQSDMTMNRRDFASEKYEYEYIDKVAASTTLKKVALFRVTDPTDIVAKTV